MSCGEKPLRSRVTLACDRCRIKKSKCDGKSPCTKCERTQTICSFSRSAQLKHYVYSQRNVQLLMMQHSKLVTALQEMYERLHDGRGWDGPSLTKTSQGVYSINDILQGLGLSAGPETDDSNIIKEQNTDVEEGNQQVQTACGTVTQSITWSMDSASTSRRCSDDTSSNNGDVLFATGSLNDDWLFSVTESPATDTTMMPSEIQWSNFMAYNLMMMQESGSHAPSALNLGPFT